MATALHLPAAERSDDAVRSPVATARRSGRIALVLGFAGLLAVVAGACAASLAVGARHVALADVVTAFTRFDGSEAHVIVRELRVPRTAVGVLAGACLGLSGTLMQGLSRNPLADPGILGVSAGSSVAVVAATTLLGAGSASSVWAAFGGALVASLLVYGLGSGGPAGASPVKLTLAGAALTAVLGSITSALIIVDDDALDRYRFWAAGSLTGRSNDVVASLVPFAVVAMAAGLACGRRLNLLALGDDVATSLGAAVPRARVAVVVAVVLTSGVAVAAAGPIGFVGLTVPHVARAITGPDHRWALPYSAALGAALVVGADVLGRVVARPDELQVGIVTALAGAPVFVVLVRRLRMGAQ